MSDPIHSGTKHFLVRVASFVMTVIAALTFTTFLHAQTTSLPIGTRVQFDKVYSSNPAQSQWIEGEITGYMPQQNYYKIRATTGINYTIANDPRWIKAAVANALAPAPQPGAITPPPPTKNLPSTPKPTPAPAGGYASGTRVEFDRVEATKPENGRWDSGTIIGRDTFHRYEIRGTNGFTYHIQDDPRWILPAGTPQPGRRHDYLDQIESPNEAEGKATATKAAQPGTMPPDGLYNVSNLGNLHPVGQLEIKGNSYRGLEASGSFKPLSGNPAALNFTAGLAGLEGVRITGANYMGLNKIGQTVIKIRYVSANGFNEELEATKEH